METLEVTNDTRKVVLGRHVGLANRFWSRLLGLLGRPPLREGEGLLLVPCQGVHTFGMRYSVDVLLLGGEGEVLALHPHMAPGGFTGLRRSARSVLELPSGTLAATGTRPGDRLSWRTAAPASRDAALPG